ncbi:MAG TPA: DUF4965 domain-containing protein [Candidatus Lokiarchaeia archaeon]|nr:DUF4965 domain-containing protein [Candidatus Lokiarchaeia archaeon]
MLMTEYVISKLGSRIVLNFRPQNREVYHSGLGTFTGERMDLVLGVGDGPDIDYFPFCQDGIFQGKVMDNTEQELRMNRVKFKAHSHDFIATLELEVIAPFYPRDIPTSILPAFFLNVTGYVEDAMWTSPEPIECEVVFGIGREKTDIQYESRVFKLEYNGSGKQCTDIIRVVNSDADLSVETLNPAKSGKPVSNEIKLIRVPVAFTRDPKPIFSMVWVSYCNEDVIETKQGWSKFKYVKDYASADDVIHYATENRDSLVEKSDKFDQVFLDTDLPKYAKDLIAFSFQTYLSTTWWTLIGATGEDWFSSWEGNCQFHSTVDVEYNLAWFYYLLWPDLLRMTLLEWEPHQKTNAGGKVFMSHDMGRGLSATKQSYGHEMEVEENANFLLMLYAYWRVTGDSPIISHFAPLISDLVDYMQWSSASGIGFPHEGTANTIDDASPAIQFAKEQTYLGVKAYGACLVAREMGRFLEADALVTTTDAILAQIAQTLEEKAWLGDHYAVCIDKTLDGFDGDWYERWKNILGDTNEIVGWDAYTLYVSNGLLIPLFTGLDFALPKDHLLADLVNAREHSLTEYGCTHSSTDHSNLWVSQNLWRDFIGYYLGYEHDDMDRYWAFEVYENTQGRGGGFTDVAGRNKLFYYPRGITSLGIFAAKLGLVMDNVTKQLKLQSRQFPRKMPILPFIDWENYQIPWVTWEPTQDGAGKVKILNENMLAGFEFQIVQKK